MKNGDPEQLGGGHPHFIFPSIGDSERKDEKTQIGDLRSFASG